MADLIDRQAAIDALEEYADRLQMVDWKENPGVPYKAYALNWCINTIRDLPSAQPEPRWTPCSERLPEALEEVLVTSKHGYVYTSRIVHGEFEYGGEVIAWMPLPEPYKEETE